MNHKKKILLIEYAKQLRNNWFVVFVLIGFIIYYAYRMFSITPWYDEIYTYINFIDKGGWYSATHWPAPNNHIFFSIISSCVSWCGHYIGLRGISFLAAVGTIVLIYKFFSELFSKISATIVAIIYSLLKLTNSLAVQGRGYSLATFFLMLAVYCGYRICYKDVKIKEYVVWGVSLWLGLYTLVSSIYWVVAVCLCTGVVLLVLNKYKNFIKLIICSIAAAIMTLISYGIMWLSIGGQSISNDITSGYYGANVWFLIKEFPRTCLKRGMDFMLNDRSVQGIDREDFIKDFHYFARDILRAFFGDNGQAFFQYYYVLVMVVALCLVAFVVLLFLKKTKYIYALALASIGFIGIYLTLLIQSAYPFIRVFSFLGIFLIMPIGIMFGMIIEQISNHIKFKYANWLGYGLFLAFVFFAAVRLMNPIYMMEYDYTDFYAYDAVSNVDWEKADTYLASDYYVEQQVEFHQNIGEDRNVKIDMEKPDIIITKKELSGTWPDIITEEILYTYYVSERPVLYENEIYIVYGDIF